MTYLNNTPPYAYAAWRLDIPTNHVQEYALSEPATTGTAGPGGLVWFCGANDVGSITEDGSASYYPAPIKYCNGITAGPDGNLWAADTGQIVRVTPGGEFTIFPLPNPTAPAWHIASAANGYVWFDSADGSDHPIIGNINVTTQRMTWYRVGHSITSISTGTDGNAYGTTFKYRNAAIIEVTPAGAVSWHFLDITVYGGANQSNVGTIWLGGDISGWSVKHHTLTTLGCCGFNPILGPDMNIWYTGGVYLRRILTVVPSAAKLRVGADVIFAITETNCPVCVWTAVSSNPGIASTSPVTSASFTVTGQSAGVTTITVSDKRQNVVRVQITVK